MAEQQGKRLAVVTGASSDNGYELARVFAAEGYDLLIASENRGIEAAAQKIATAGTKVEAVQADLSQYEGVETT
jgi:short-subunit dehydrogenase